MTKPGEQKDKDRKGIILSNVGSIPHIHRLNVKEEKLCVYIMFINL